MPVRHAGISRLETQRASAAAGAEMLHVARVALAEGLGVENRVLDLAGRTGEPGRSLAEQGTGGTDLEAVAAGLLHLRLLDAEAGAVVVLVGHVAEEQLVDVRHAGGEHAVEKVATGRRR